MSPSTMTVFRPIAQRRPRASFRSGPGSTRSLAVVAETDQIRFRSGSLVVNGPPLVRFDIGASKRVKVHGPVTFEFRAEMLNAFNKPYFNPASTAGTPLGFTSTFFPNGGQGPVANNGTLTSNTTVGSSADSSRLTALLGDNTARIIQLVWRVRW